MFAAKKVYIGTVDKIELAAIIYDIFQIQYKGLKAKTNFNYSRFEITEIMKQPMCFIFSSKNKPEKCKID